LVGIFHYGPFSGFIFRYFQHMVAAPFDATSASGTSVVFHKDDLVSVLPLPVQVEGNPQKQHDSHTDIYYFHIIVF
jgi:hypothetical protein